MILRRLQALLGADVVERIEICRTGNIPSRALSPHP
jgi:hypothetical protein